MDDQEEQKKKEYKLTALNSKNAVIDVTVHECQHCRELIPKVGECSSCGMPYTHIETIENFKTGFLNYVYECGGCPENQRRAQKTLKLTEVVDDTRINMRKNLADDFLKSGGY